MANEVKLSGPLFSAGASELAKAEAALIVRELIEDGTQHLAEMLRPRPAGVYLSVAEAQKGKASTGNYRRNVTPILSGITGRIHDNNVVYGPWLEFGGKRFKGYAAFRKTSDWLNEQADSVVEKHAKALAARLNGV